MKDLDNKNKLSKSQMSELLGGVLRHSSFTLGTLSAQDTWDDPNNDGEINPDEVDSFHQVVMRA